MGNNFEKVTQDINDDRARRLVKLAKDAGVSRFVFASSCSMYGMPKAARAREDDSLNPLTAYARSKMATEKVLRITLQTISWLRRYVLQQPVA